MKHTGVAACGIKRRGLDRLPWLPHTRRVTRQLADTAPLIYPPTRLPPLSPCHSGNTTKVMPAFGKTLNYSTIRIPIYISITIAQLLICDNGDTFKYTRLNTYTYSIYVFFYVYFTYTLMYYLY